MVASKPDFIDDQKIVSVLQNAKAVQSSAEVVQVIEKLRFPKA